MYPVGTVDEAVQLESRAKTQLARAPTRPYPSTRLPITGPTQDPVLAQGKDPIGERHQPPTTTNRDMGSDSRPQRAAPTTADSSRIPNPYARPRSNNCYLCGQPGHLLNTCPQRPAAHLTINEGGTEDEAAEEDHGFDEHKQITEKITSGDEVTAEDRGEFLVVRRLLYALRKELHPQRHNIFHTRCTVNSKVCDVIIDSGSSENIISRVMVDKLQLPMTKHPSPYSIGWIKKVNETKVTEQCTISFSIGKNYND